MSLPFGDRCYGVDREELEEMRAAAALAAEERGSMRDHLVRVRAYLRKHGRTTTKGLAKALDLWRSDAANAVGQLVSTGELERDGEVSDGRDGRWVALYRWTGEQRA